MLGFLFVSNGKLHVKNTGLTAGGMLAIIYVILLFLCVEIVSLLMLQGFSCPLDSSEFVRSTWLLPVGFLIVFIIGTVIGMISAHIYNILHPGKPKKHK